MGGFFHSVFQVFFLIGYVLIFVVTIIILRPFRVHRRRLKSTVALKISYLLYQISFLVFTYLLLFGNKELAEDEYYLVSIDYNYVEANPRITYTTRETQFTLPESLYSTPNCSVFNWRVTLMQQTGVREDGQPKGKPVSFNSLYWYIQWFYPPGQEAPFKPRCPNEQF